MVMVMVLDDICRDIYEINVRKQRFENLGNTTYSGRYRKVLKWMI
ncbi:hypothetical protein MHK_008299 [Candidatus Magnetomorum sp. HK-1]|nr:hypothetical protein MHK_008299 [Candidatus Magnetomorum sp. HK-1]